LPEAQKEAAIELPGRADLMLPAPITFSAAADSRSAAPLIVDRFWSAITAVADSTPRAAGSNEKPSFGVHVRSADDAIGHRLSIRIRDEILRRLGGRDTIELRWTDGL